MPFAPLLKQCLVPMVIDQICVERMNDPIYSVPSPPQLQHKLLLLLYRPPLKPTITSAFSLDSVTPFMASIASCLY